MHSKLCFCFKTTKVMINPLNYDNPADFLIDALNDKHLNHGAFTPFDRVDIMAEANVELKGKHTLTTHTHTITNREKRHDFNLNK
jgi:hypothetical protein